jgi:hypothetical protein
MRRIVIVAMLAMFAAVCAAQEEKPAVAAGQANVRNFDQDQPGQPPKGFTVVEGTWRVYADEDAPSKPNTLGQDAASDKPTYNLVLADEPRPKDLDLTVRMKSLSGDVDQGGGLVWRAKDAKNYYVCRFNPLEKNYRVYRVVDGKRTQLLSADLEAAAGWHLLRTTMKGDQIRCYMDDKELLTIQDATFPNAGKVGLWTKADAKTRFDDLSVGTVGAP